MEKKAWKSFFQDGLWDIYFGLLLLGLASSSFYFLIDLPEPINLFVIIIPIYIIAILILTLGKKYVTTPRMGVVKFGLKRKKIKKRLVVLMAVQVGFLVMMVILTLLGLFQFLQINSSILMLILGLSFIAFPLGFLAYFWDFPRLYIYGILGGSGFFFAEILHPIIEQPFDLFIPYLLISGSIIFVGIYYFINFFHKYPKLVR